MRSLHKMDELSRIALALRGVRPDAAGLEEDLHRKVAEALSCAGIAFLHEARIAPGARVDFLAGRVGIEVKCRHAGRAALVRQAQKYLRCEALDALVVATRSGVDLPRHIAGKPVATVCLSRNWGIAL